ncbi:MAG TPA: 2TM domain-containing protein [Flavobacteriaceae bacterium]|nr:2TM domain-containing protein [Flavobacteriaceae bacterium]HPF12360.1 2TM domain-containing protein [Flavobacteriaceae bacterium]HQU22600.1 2TM domain-containing protein [Flavobacteriaceae bacterium]HQU66264.1 2TM domain-containing protein [Flavobacteriaceae bacterium]HRW45783.1 2TM domain-containing protein [Flavobacteriaceae bacterium]
MQFFRELGKAFFVGTMIFLVAGIIQYINGVEISSGKELLQYFLFNQLYSVTLYMVNAYFFNFLMNRYKGEWFKGPHLLRGMLGTVVISLVTIFIIRWFIHVVWYGETFSGFLNGEQPRFYYLALLISVVVTAIFYGIYYYRFTQERKVKEQKIIAGTASAQFDALKNQLDPHFLFNSLNVLTSLIEENPHAATKFTTSLSKVYRYVLEQKNKELVTVEEELQFAQLYMSLIEMRFEDSIVFEVPQTLSNPEAKVVPLSLQLLLENAVKHNQVTPQNKLHIRIYEENGNLVVKNNRQPKTVVKESSGVGLRNIRQRYYLLTQRPVTVEQNEKEFWVAIPLLTKKANVMNTQTQYISEKRYERAKKQVENIKGFYIHFTIYLIMVPVFIYLNIISTSFPWAMFPIFGWGMGIAGHAFEAFNYNPILGRKWEERKIRELMDKDH